MNDYSFFVKIFIPLVLCFLNSRYMLKFSISESLQVVEILISYAILRSVLSFKDTD